MVEQLKEYQRYASKAHKDLTAIGNSFTADELRDAWENFLFNFGRAIGRLITIALNNAETRSWGHRLKNASNGSDPGLHYLREARNSAEHGIGPFARFNPAGANIGQGAIFSAGGTVTITNSQIGGRYVDYLEVGLEDGGRLANIKGNHTDIVAHVAASITLKPLSNPEKPNQGTVKIPNSIGPYEISSQVRPLEMAQLAMKHLDNLAAELQEKMNSQISSKD